MVPEIQSPEFYHVPVEYAADDHVPQTAMRILQFIANEYGQSFLLGSLAFNQFVARQQPPSGSQLDPEHDQPVLSQETVNYQGEDHEHSANLYGVWLAQRSQRFYQSLSQSHQASVDELLGPGLLADLVSAPVTVKLVRVNNRLVTA